MNEHRIKAENVGPVKALDIAVSPGLNVLRGANGSGKSTVLQAVNYALTRTGDKPTPRDGTRAGKLDCFGVQASFASRATLKGTLEVESLSGRLDLGDLISPGYESEEVNDARRIKRLIELSGAQADEDAFEPLLQQTIGEGQMPTDLVDAVDWAKRELQGRAREAEQQAERMALQAAAARKAAEGVDATVETDRAVLQERLQEASIAEHELQIRHADIAARLKAAEKAREELEATRSANVPTVGAAEMHVDYAQQHYQLACQRRLALEKELETATQAERERLNEVKAAKQKLDYAKTHDTAMQVWEAQVAKAEQLQPISDAELEAARDAVTAARKAIEAGAVARKAKEQLAAADDFQEAAQHAAVKAEDLRRKAAATDDILAAELQRIGCPWRPVDVPTKSGSVRRLVVNHRRGEQTLVSDLSEGERAKHAIDVALSLAGKSDRPAVLILRQEVYEGLQPKVRDEIDQHAKERNVVILTAAASDDEEVTI